MKNIFTQAKSIFLIGTLSIFCLMTANANDTLRITLNQALEIGLSNNPSIKIAEKEIKRVDYANKERFAGLFPTISANASYQRAIKKQKMFFSLPGMPSNPDGIEVGQDNSFSAGLAAQMPIIAPTLWANLKLTQYDAEFILESARSSKIALANQIKKSYYGILLAKDSYNVFEQSYRNTKNNTQIITNKYKVGSVSEFEWIRSDVQLQNATSNLVAAQSAVNMSKLQIKMLLGLDSSTEIEVEGSLKDFEQQLYVDILTIDTTSLIENTDIKQFDIKTSQLKQSKKIQQSNWYPTLATSFNYDYMAMANDEIAFANYYWFPNSSLRISLSIPLFQGGSRLMKLKQLDTQLSEMNDQRTNLQRNLELQAQSQVENMKKALEKVASNKKALTQAEKAVSIAQKMYEVGSGTFLDVANSELAYIQSGLTYNQAIFDYISSKADLEKLIGIEISK